MIIQEWSILPGATGKASAERCRDRVEVSSCRRVETEPTAPYSESEK
jgi:hypothetical protein